MAFWNQSIRNVFKPNFVKDCFPVWPHIFFINSCVSSPFQRFSVSRTMSLPSKFHSFSSTSANHGTENGNDPMTVSHDLKNQNEIIMQHARQIFNKAVASVLPHEIIKRHLQFDQNSNVLAVDGHSYRLHQNVHIAGFGKAVLGMARTVDEVIGQHIVQGVISVPVGAQRALREAGKLDMIPKSDSKIEVCEGAANNLPDEEAYKTAIKIKDMAMSVREEDILLVLISGGGSALLPTPPESICLDDLLQVAKQMSLAGANIKQLNYMRKQMEILKGGGLAKLAYPAKVIALILSDVIGDPLDFIASGPTVPDTSTPEGCLSLFSQLGIEDKIPKSVTDVLRQKQASKKHQVPSDVMDWNRVQNIIIGSNSIACKTAASVGEDLGYLPYILSTELDGEARTVGTAFVTLAMFILASQSPSLYGTDIKSLKSELVNNFKLTPDKLDELAGQINSTKNMHKNILVLAGGETTVTVQGSGKGGRNQEMALAAAIELDHCFSTTVIKLEQDLQKDEKQKQSNVSEYHAPNSVSVVFLSGGTDGQDGPTPAAGGVITLDFVLHSNQCGFNPQHYLDNNDSYTLLRSVNKGQYLLETGLTGTNVMDINLLLVRRNTL